MTRAPLQARPHALYRFFSADDVLLYVGITCDIGHRWTKHSYEKVWWNEVSRTTIEHFDDRRSVLEAEREAIVNEKPAYNIRLKTNRRDQPVAKTSGGESRDDRLSKAESQPFNTDSLIGSFFLSDSERGWQGCVVAEPFPGVYLVETFSWIAGDSYSQELVPLGEMKEWTFYDTADWMQNAYEHDVQRRWDAERAERKQQA